MSVDPASADAPFEQIRRHFAAQIAEGSLAPGTRLPTVRALAERLGLAVNTVARAYRELETAGLVATRGRNGTVVAGATPAAERARRAAASFASRAREAGLTPEQAVDMARAAVSASASASEKLT